MTFEKYDARIVELIAASRTIESLPAYSGPDWGTLVRAREIILAEAGTTQAAYDAAEAERKAGKVTA